PADQQMNLCSRLSQKCSTLEGGLTSPNHRYDASGKSGEVGMLGDVRSQRSRLHLFVGNSAQFVGRVCIAEMSGRHDNGSCRNVFAIFQREPKAVGDDRDVADLNASNIPDATFLKPVPIVDEHANWHW